MVQGEGWVMGPLLKLIFLLIHTYQNQGRQSLDYMESESPGRRASLAAMYPLVGRLVYLPVQWA